MDCDEGVPWALWERSLSLALGSSRGQQALAGMEAALLALPEPKLIHGHLAAEGGVCAIGAYVAHCEATRKETSVEAEIAAMQGHEECWCGHDREAHKDGPCTEMSRWAKENPCSCTAFGAENEDAFETVEAGRRVGLGTSIAWHLAEMNDERFDGLSPEERFTKMLAWVRRAQGKDTEVAA